MPLQSVNMSFVAGSGETSFKPDPLLPGRKTAQITLSPLWSQLTAAEQKLLADPVDSAAEAYLDAVRDLLNLALKTHQARSGAYWSPKGRFRQMAHIVEVNHNLDELLKDLRERRPGMQLVRRLDRIRGLLLDIFL